MEMWKLCYPDVSDAFTALWFDRVYRDEQMLVAKVDGRVVSALQIVPYGMSYFGECLPAAYVCGVCTRPDERGKGRMTRLMRRATAVMRERGFALATLIPGEEWLFGYYRRLGYAVAFDCSVEMHRLHDAGDCRIVTAGSFTDDGLFLCYDRIQRARPCAILHGADDLENVRLDCRTDGGDCWVTDGADGQPAGIAFAGATDDGTIFIKEIVCDDDSLRDAMIQALMRHYRATAARVRVPPATTGSAPFGMACVLDVGRMCDIRPPAGAVTPGDASCTQILLQYDRRLGYMNLMLD
jgi:GNAT superfamily N-acetyltransferase